MMVVFTKSLAFFCILILSGCGLNQTVKLHEGDAEATVPTSSISLYVYPKTKSASNDVESGYFVEFDLADQSDVPTIKYQD